LANRSTGATFSLQARPEKRQQGADDRYLTGPVRDDPRPFMGDLFEQLDMIQRKRLCDRVIKKIIERDVDFGQVEQQENHGRTGQRNAEVHPVKAVARRSQHRVS
jgi:hypothetical protein